MSTIIDLKREICKMKSGQQFRLSEAWCEEQGLKDYHVRSWGRIIAKDPNAFELEKDFSGKRIVDNIGNNRSRYYIKK